MSDANTSEKLWEVDGLAIKVFVGVSPDRRHIEYILESDLPIDPISAAKVLEVLGHQMLKGVYVPPQIYAKERK